MIYTVTLNPSIDYAMELKSINIGSVNRTTATRITAGGKGINVSKVLKSLGVESTILGFTAGFTGEEIERSLVSEAYNCSFIHLPRGLSRINVKLTTDVTTDINGDGPGVERKDLEALFARLEQLGPEDYLVLAGAIPGSLPNYTYQLIMERVRDKGVRVILDASGEQLLSALMLNPYLIKPNRHELEELFSISIRLRSEVDRYALELIDRGAQNVLISLDSEGAVLANSRKELYHIEAPQGLVVNPVGAGDSMVAGYIYGLLKGLADEDILKLCVAAGSATAFSTGFASAEDIISLYRFM